MQCPRCGTENPQGGDTCYNCGNDLKGPVHPTGSQPPYTQPQVPQPQMPQYGVSQPVPTYLVQSILVTLCCCLPAGIPAIVFAAQVNSKLQMGDVQGAIRSSNNARTWCWVSFGLGIAIAAFQLIWLLVGVGGTLLDTQ